MFRLRIMALLINSSIKYDLARMEVGPQAGQSWVPNTFPSHTQTLDP